MNFNDEIVAPARIKQKLTPQELMEFLFGKDWNEKTSQYKKETRRQASSKETIH